MYDRAAAARSSGQLMNFREEVGMRLMVLLAAFSLAAGLGCRTTAVEPRTSRGGAQPGKDGADAGANAKTPQQPSHATLPEAEDDEANAAPDATAGGHPTGPSAAPAVGKTSYDALAPTVAAACVSCHRPGGSRAVSDLTTLAGVKRYKEAIVTMVVGKRMPPGRPLDVATITTFATWRDDGYMPGTGAASAAGSTPAAAAAASTQPAATDRPVFRIKAGTGAGAWNTAATSVNFRVGDTLRIYNDDTIAHQLHTNGAPCPHGAVIRPGSYGECRAARAYTGKPLYDHNSGGAFFLRVDP